MARGRWPGFAATIMALWSHPAPSLGDTSATDDDVGECAALPGFPLHVQLNNGVKVPRIGFGTAGLGAATEESVSLALAAGYRHIDSAQAQEWYREDAVGRALKSVTSSWPQEGMAASTTAEESPSSAKEQVSRGDVFVTTKVHPRDFSTERLNAVVQTSREHLEGVDLLLLHSPNCWPGACPDNPTPWQEAWRGLEGMYSRKEVRAIGVSNFSGGLLRELLSFAAVVPAVVQNWMDPFHQDKVVRGLCAEEGIAYVSYSTLGGQWTYRQSTRSSPNPVSTDATIGTIAATHGTSRQTVVLSWALQRGAIILPRSSNPGRIRDNLQAFLGADATAAAGSEACSAAEGNIKLFLAEHELREIDLLDGTLEG